MMRHALGVLLACAGALALDETAGSDVSVSARLVLATDFDAATFNADWYARVPLRRALAPVSYTHLTLPTIYSV